MKRTLAASLLASLALATHATQAADIELVVDYAYPELFNTVHQEIAQRFQQKFPQYSVKFRAPAPDYEVATQQALRHAVTKQSADVSFQALNRQRLFVERGLTVDLAPFIQAEPDWAQRGYSQALMSLGQVNGQQAGIGFSLSTPIVYYNLDLIGKAGASAADLPKTWDGIIALADKAMAATPGTSGLYYDWEISGNWFWQAMVFSLGGQMMDAAGKQIAFDNDAGKQAIEQIGRMTAHGTMPNLSYGEAAQLFVSGRLAILSSTTARLAGFEKQINGRFKIATGFFPVPNEQGRVPAGGNVAMMFTQDPERQKAAWEYIKFATGPEGATIMTRGTGYFPANTLPIEDPALLKGFYEAHPNQYTAVKQQPWLTGWFAFPGDNGLKITDVIHDHLQTVVDKSAAPQAALEQMATDVQKLLPR